MTQEHQDEILRLAARMAQRTAEAWRIQCDPVGKAAARQKAGEARDQLAGYLRAMP